MQSGEPEVSPRDNDEAGRDHGSMQSPDDNCRFCGLALRPRDARNDAGDAHAGCVESPVEEQTRSTWSSAPLRRSSLNGGAPVTTELAERSEGLAEHQYRDAHRHEEKGGDRHHLVHLAMPAVASATGERARYRPSSRRRTRPNGS